MSCLLVYFAFWRRTYWQHMLKLFWGERTDNIC